MIPAIATEKEASREAERIRNKRIFTVETPKFQASESPMERALISREKRNSNGVRIKRTRPPGINKTESAIRITHIPTGIVVACQNERSQHKNRDTAMKMLYMKLLELKEKAHKEKIEDLQGEQLDIGW